MDLLGLFGVQGDPQVVLLVKGDTNKWFHSGLLMARTYAIASKSRVVLAVLGILFLGSFVSVIVCGPSHLHRM
jgi:hypothetical protein